MFYFSQYMINLYIVYLIKMEGRSENPGVPVLFDGHSLPPLVEIGLTGLPKSGHPQGPLLTASFLGQKFIQVST